jgi:hypothetical protein
LIDVKLTRGKISIEQAGKFVDVVSVDSILPTPAYTREACPNPKCVDGKIPGTRPGVMSPMQHDRRRRGNCPDCYGRGYIEVRR